MNRVRVLACLGMALGWMGRADAFCLNAHETIHPRFSWKTDTGKVRYRVSSSLPGTQLDAVKAVFDAWTVQCSTLSFEFVSDAFDIADTAFTQPGTDKAEIHVFWVSSSVDKDKVGMAGGISKNFVAHDGNDELLAASIALNSYDHVLSGADDVSNQEFDLRAVLARAVGVTLGLDNSDQPAKSILLDEAFIGGANADGRAPKEDDVDGVQYLYWDAEGDCAAEDKPDGPGENCGKSGGPDAGAGLDARPGTDGGADGSTGDDAGRGDDAGNGSGGDDGGCSCATRDVPGPASTLAALVCLLLFGSLSRLVPRLRDSDRLRTAIDAHGCVAPPRNLPNIPPSSRLALGANASSSTDHLP